MAEEFILLPERGLRLSMRSRFEFVLRDRGGEARSTGSPVTLSFDEKPHLGLRVIDSIHEDGPKLVAGTGETVLELRRQGLKAVPLVTYQVASRRRFNPKPPPSGSLSAKVRVSVTSRGTGQPVPSAVVAAFINFAAYEGAEGVTDANGIVELALGRTALTIERLYVLPPLAGFWGRYLTGVTVNQSIQVDLKEVQTTSGDAIRHFYGSGPASQGSGVTVGIVDTGIDNSHAGLQHVTTGENTARGEPQNLWQDNGTGHGTHVAGIIGARGVLQGLAPAAELISYRAFPQDSLATTNYQILKAIIRAMDHGCHIINLSLSGEPREDETLRRALEDAKDRGILVVVAAGNEGNTRVGYPAYYAFSEGLSVSAMGRRNTFPAGSVEESEVGLKVGFNDPDNFVAGFTNTGDVSLIAPGVGILSTVPGGYGPMSGTSMACPAVAGLAARILSRDLAANGNMAVLRQPPDSSRTMQMIALISNSAVKIFGDPKVEGDGMIL